MYFLGPHVKMYELRKLFFYRLLRLCRNFIWSIALWIIRLWRLYDGSCHTYSEFLQGPDPRPISLLIGESFSPWTRARFQIGEQEPTQSNINFTIFGLDLWNLHFKPLSLRWLLVLIILKGVSFWLYPWYGLKYGARKMVISTCLVTIINQIGRPKPVFNRYKQTKLEGFLCYYFYKGVCSFGKGACIWIRYLSLFT